MELYEWLWRGRMRGSLLAQRLGIHYQTIARLVNRVHTPTLITAIAINEVTGGQVGYKDLLTAEDVIRLDEILARYRAAGDSKAVVGASGSSEAPTVTS